MKYLHHVVASFLLLFSIYGALQADTRTSTVEFNPGCDNATLCGNETTLVYVKAKGDSDMLHILYSSIGAFTVMLFKTDLDSMLTVNWTNLLSQDAKTMFDSIKFSKQPNDSIAFTVAKIYEFNDKHGDADMSKIPVDNLTNSTNWLIRDTATDLLWRFENKSSPMIGTFVGRPVDPKANGTFQFNLRYYGKEERDKELPHLLVTGDSTSIDFIIDSIAPAFKDSKFAFGILTTTNIHNVELKNSKSLDDEFTPGTFQLWTVEANDAAMKTHSYLQWRPIFYFDKESTLENSTETRQYKLGMNRSLPISIASAFYDSSVIRCSEFNISFGLEGNEKDAYFYPQSNYSSFTFMTGMGTPGDEKMTTLVKLLIFIGFGLPGAVIVLGVFILLVKKCRQSSRQGYETL